MEKARFKSFITEKDRFENCDLSELQRIMKELQDNLKEVLNEINLIENWFIDIPDDSECLIPDFYEKRYEVQNLIRKLQFRINELVGEEDLPDRRFIIYMSSFVDVIKFEKYAQAATKRAFEMIKQGKSFLEILDFLASERKNYAKRVKQIDANSFGERRDLSLAEDMSSYDMISYHTDVIGLYASYLNRIESFVNQHRVSPNNDIALHEAIIDNVSIHLSMILFFSDADDDHAVWRVLHTAKDNILLLLAKVADDYQDIVNSDCNGEEAIQFIARIKRYKKGVCPDLEAFCSTEEEFVANYNELFSGVSYTT